MKNFKQLVKELPSSKVVVGFGTFQPPTSVHEHLVKAVKTVAGDTADYAIYASANEDKKYNPLSVDRKVYFLNRMFPGTQFKETAETTIVGLAKKLNEKYKVLTVVVGEDKVADVTKQLNKANGKEYTFESIKVISTGVTDPDSDLTPGVSGMRMCESAKAGKFEDFKKGLPHTLTEHDSRRLMNEVRKGLGQEPIKEQVVLTKDKLREDYFSGKIFNVGDLVESNGQQYEIVKRGSNHLLLKEESGALVSKWIQDVKLVTEQLQESDMSKEVTKEKISKKYRELIKKSTMSEPPVEIGEPVKGDGKEQPKTGDKNKKNESDLHKEDVYTSDTKEKDYMTKDAEGNWVWRKRKIHPKRVTFNASKMGGTPDQKEQQDEAYVKKTAYQKLNARMKTITGKSLDDRAREAEKAHQETLAHATNYKAKHVVNNESVEFRIDHRDEAKGDVKPTLVDHEAKVSDTTDKATYIKVPKHKADSFKQTMKTRHGVTAELAEEVIDESMTDSWKNVQSMDKGSVLSGKESAKKRLAYLNAVHAHHKKFGNDTKKVKGEIESINRSRVAEELDLSEDIKKEYDSLKKNHDIKSLRGLIKTQHKIVDTSEFKTKEHAISHYLRAKHGNSKVAAAFGLSENYDDNRTGFTKNKREDDEYHNEPKPAFKAKSTMDRPHTVHIDGKPWKKFSNGHQANAAVRTLTAKGKKAVATAHFSEETISEGEISQAKEKKSYGVWILQQKAGSVLKKPKAEQVKESALNPNDPHGDYKAKSKAIQDIQMHPDTHKDPELKKAVIQRKADLEKEYSKFKESIDEGKKKSYKKLKSQIQDKETMPASNTLPPFDAFSSTS